MGQESALTLTIGQVATYLGISSSHAYELARQDALPVPVLRLGRRRVVPKAAFLRSLGVSLDGELVA